MTTVVFNPNNSNAPPFSASVVIDGATYQMTGVWNSAGNRWYAQLVDASGNVVLYAPMTTSPDGTEIYIQSAIVPAGSLYVDDASSTIVTS